MSVIYGLENLLNDDRPRAVAIGVFDGVHWGHRAIFTRVMEAAKETGAIGTAMTFDKHPIEQLAPALAPYYINTLEQRVELINSVGVEEVVVAEFSPGLAHLTHDEFIDKVLVKFLRARHVVVGSNFRFGKDRTGDIRYMASVLPDLGIGISVVPSVIIAGGPVSSTRIRMLIGRGDIAEAAKLLGRKFTLQGTVVKGKQLGRTIGFPTANIQTAPRQLIPARGVYVVECTVDKTTYSGVCNIGSRPTFAGESETVEVHLASFQGDLYGRNLDIVFCRRLRDEMKFESPEKLADQIRLDLEKAIPRTI